MNYDELAKQLVIDEGFRSKVYQCSAGKWTIGIGRNVEDVGITTEEAFYLLRNDIDRVCAELDARLPWWRKLSDRRRQALVNFVFNVGITTAMKFKNTLGLLQSGKYDEAASEILRSRWAEQVGARARRIAKLIREG